MSRGLAAVLSAAVIAAAIAVGVWQVQPPAPAAADAPTASFSAARALDHVRVLASAPRTLGSDAHDRARDYLVETLRAAGVDATVQSALALADGDRQAIGSVDNVVGRLVGSDRAQPAILLVAHYDSVSIGPGASDNASGVAVVLEALRALAARAPPRADVVALFTDGEEDGLLGARAFLQSIAAAPVGVVLNFDNAGSSGPSVMYQTSDGNARLVDVFAACSSPLGSSLIDEIARRGRVQSDFSPLREAALPAMTFGLSEGFVRNHTPLDTPDRVDAGSLQQQGEQALTLVRRLDATTGTSAGPAPDGESVWTDSKDVVYFPVSRGRLAVYSRSWTPALVGLAWAAFGVVLAFGLLRHRLDGFSLVSGAVNSLLTLVFMSALTAVFWGFGWVEANGGDASGLPFASDLAHRAGLTLIVLAVGLALYLWGLDAKHANEAQLGAALWWLVLMAYVSVALPGGAYLLVWPLLASLAAVAVALVRCCPAPVESRQPVSCLVVRWVGALPALLLFSSSIYLLFTVNGMRLLAVVVCIWLLLGALSPQLALLGHRGRRIVPAACGVAGLAIVVGLSPLTGLADDPPAPVQLHYRYDAVSKIADWGRFAWAGDAQIVSDLVWRSSIDPETGNPPHDPTAAWGEGPPPDVPLRPPTAALVADRDAGSGRRLVTLLLRPAGRATVLSLMVGSQVGELEATAGGLSLDGADTRLLDAGANRWHVDWYAPRREGIVVQLTIDAGRRLRLRLVELRRGLPGAPALQAPARPQEVGPAGLGDATVVATGYVLGARIGAPLRSLTEP